MHRLWASAAMEPSLGANHCLLMRRHREVMFVDSLPKTSVGKLDKKFMRSRHAEQLKAQTTGTA